MRQVFEVFKLIYFLLSADTDFKINSIALGFSVLVKMFLAGIYLVGVNNGNTRAIREICVKAAIKTPKWVLSLYCFGKKICKIILKNAD